MNIFVARWLRVLGCVGALLGARIAAAEADAGSIVAGKHFSAALGEEIFYRCYLPPGYAAATAERHPVVYLLHGRGDTMEAWLATKPELDRLIVAREIPPVIAVMPDAPSNRRAGYYVDSRSTGGRRVETAFTTDLVAHIDAAFRTRARREARVVGGYSMGGYGALRFALAHPEIFGAAIVLSPAVYHPLPPLDSSAREFGAFGEREASFVDAIYREKNYAALLPAFRATKRPLVMFIAVGDDEATQADADGTVHDLDQEAHALYSAVRRVSTIDAQLRVLDGGHNWETWRPAFVEGLRYVFKRLPR